MARPKKETIDYFPHYVTGGKTLFILENSYGNDGYAFWFKLLEILGSSNGHYYDARNKPEWRFLVAKTRVSEETATEILNTLADIDAIDKELWSQKIIWVQHLVDNVADVYKKRNMELPKKPFQIPACDGNASTPVVSDSENPQSKVEESKVKESIGENNVSVPETLSLDTQAIELCQLYEKLKSGESISAQLPAIRILLQDYGFDWTKEAIEMCVSKKNSFIKPWIEKVLKNWKTEGHTCNENKADNSPVKRNAFGNYSGQRKYDIKELRKQLLGRDTGGDKGG